MEFEPLGIGLGDWVAIVALVSSALIFLLGYSRTRKSEQIRIAREAWLDVEKYHLIIEEKLVPFRVFRHKLTLMKDRKSHLGDEDKKVLKDVEDNLKPLYEELNTLFNHMLKKIGYFILLMDKKEIYDKELLRFYEPLVTERLKQAEGFSDQYSKFSDQYSKKYGDDSTTQT